MLTSMHRSKTDPVSRGSCLTAILRMAGLRPTRQRLALADLIFGAGHRHISAESLHAEAAAGKVRVSLATVYNSLRQFKEAGLLREVTVDPARTYFDTNTSDHHHFFIEDEDRVVDIPGNNLEITGLPEAPSGMKITHVDVVVRVKRADRI